MEDALGQAGESVLGQQQLRQLRQRGQGALLQAFDAVGAEAGGKRKGRMVLKLQYIILVKLAGAFEQSS